MRCYNLLIIRAMAGDTTLGENYAFAGMHYIFDQHSEAGWFIHSRETIPLRFLSAQCPSLSSLQAIKTNWPAVRKMARYQYTV